MTTVVREVAEEAAGPRRAPVTCRFERYVALGDSSTEGLDDPDGRGGYRGWADRLAARLAAAQGSVLYANLGVRGRRTGQILAEQVPRAVAMRPDLATVFSGTNDVLARRFDLDAYCDEVAAIHRALIAGGATVLTFNLPDLSPVMPLARRLAPRVRALDAALRAVCADTGARLVDLAAHPVAVDPRLWSADRLHANAAGHARIAAALAEALGLAGTDRSWAEPLPAAPPRGAAETWAAEAGWALRHLLPWAWGHLRGRGAGDGRLPKRPELRAVRPAPLAEVAP